MGAPTTYTYTNTYKVGRGRLAFNQLNDDGEYEGFRWLGNCPGFEINVESENLQHTSSEGGLAEVDLDTPLSITRTATISIDNFSADNLAIFLGASVADLAQASATVTNELVEWVRTERFYQLGTSVLTTGSRSITGVTVDVYAPARANSTAYVVGDMYLPATPNDHVYICTVAGTSDATPPTFNVAGSTHTDGTATFKDAGLTSTLTSGTDYLLDGTHGIVSIGTTGQIADIYNSCVTAVGAGNFNLRLHVDYTRPANSREQIATGAAGAVEGQLKFVADNPIGANQDVLIPSCTLRPNGAMPFITAGEVAAVELAVGISVLNTTTSAIYIDGRPA